MTVSSGASPTTVQQRCKLVPDQPDREVLIPARTARHLLERTRVSLSTGRRVNHRRSWVLHRGPQPLRRADCPLHPLDLRPRRAVVRRRRRRKPPAELRRVDLAVAVGVERPTEHLELNVKERQ